MFGDDVLALFLRSAVIQNIHTYIDPTVKLRRKFKNPNSNFFWHPSGMNLTDYMAVRQASTGH